MKHVLSVVFVTFLMVFLNFAPAEAGYKRNSEGYIIWKTVGSDPCVVAGKNTCTVEKAFDYSGFSPDVQKLLKKEIDSGNKKVVPVSSGEKFSLVQFHNDRFFYKVLTAWPKGEVRYADFFSVLFKGTIYEAYLFHKCGNWAMRSKLAPITVIKSPTTFARGDIPKINCGGASCASCS